MARLIIFDESVRGVDLPDRVVIVGRSLKADIPIHDRLLSRKHCTLVPDGGTFRFVDLKSANGSYVNGVRVEKAELEYDDIIEVGNTVMVLLESDTWERGEGLAKLRNPIKAQELIARIKRRTGSSPDREGDFAAPPGSGSGSTSPPKSRGADRPAGAGQDGGGRGPLGGDLQWTKDLLEDFALTPELLEGFLTSRIVSLLVRRTPELRECLSDAMERVLTPESFQGGFERFRWLVREAIRASLAEVGLGIASADPGSRSQEQDAAGVPDAPGVTPPEPTPPQGETASARPSSRAASEDGPL